MSAAMIAVISDGELAALATALCWAVGALAFTYSGRRIGSQNVNLIRLVLASVIMGAAVWIGGVDTDVPTTQFWLLALSGFIGLVLGDAAYFESLVVLGARRATLLTTLTPVFVVILMVPLLNERIDLLRGIGMALTLIGVMVVILERSSGGELRGSLAWGVFLGVIGALWQASGFLVAKAGLGMADPNSLLVEWAALPIAPDAEGIPRAGTEVSPILGTFIRMAAAGVVLWTLVLLRGRIREVFTATQDRRALGIVVIGTVIGPALGVALSLYALGHANSAVASTIMATMPIMVIPMVMILYKEKVTWRGFGGSLLALAGVVLLIDLPKTLGW